MTNENKISSVDIYNLKIIRSEITNFLKKELTRLDKEGNFLDIAPQDWEGAKPFLKKAKYYTLDIDKNSGADFITDICIDNSNLIPNEFFDCIICTEVLEHTLNPFSAINEIYRMLKKDGTLLLSVPFNLRIHGPLPDCWRFTEYGLKELLKEFKEVKILKTESIDRFLMPIHYRVIAKK